jgi:hypothetical protein
VRALAWRGLSTLAETFPRSIQETITFVSELGERYLWIDSLCIVQDDETVKHGQVMNMEAIYGNASFTIIAAGGEDADAGLPGVVPGGLWPLSTIPSTFIANARSGVKITLPRTLWLTHAFPWLTTRSTATLPQHAL